MREWIEQFIEGVEKVELFYYTKLEEYIQEFDHLKEMFMRKKAG